MLLCLIPSTIKIKFQFFLKAVTYPFYGMVLIFPTWDSVWNSVYLSSNLKDKHFLKSESCSLDKEQKLSPDQWQVTISTSGATVCSPTTTPTKQNEDFFQVIVQVESKKYKKWPKIFCSTGKSHTVPESCHSDLRANIKMISLTKDEMAYVAIKIISIHISVTKSMSFIRAKKS